MSHIAINSPQPLKPLLPSCTRHSLSHPSFWVNQQLLASTVNLTFVTCGRKGAQGKRERVLPLLSFPHPPALSKRQRDPGLSQSSVSTRVLSSESVTKSRPQMGGKILSIRNVFNTDGNVCFCRDFCLTNFLLVNTAKIESSRDAD